MMSSCQRVTGASTAEDRTALFDEILEKIMARDAFVPIKLERLGVNVRESILRYRDEMINADTDEKLFYTLLKISNARKDPHVRASVVKGGLKVEGIDPCDSVRIHQTEIEQAPIRFSVDYGDPDEYFLFVSDYSRDIGDYVGTDLPEVGDRLLSVNGQPFADYLVCVEPYSRYATIEGFWWRMAPRVSQKTFEYAPHFFGEGVTYTLQRRNGDEYTVSLPYLDPDSVKWEGYYKEHGDFRYPGFTKLLETPTYHLYEYEGDADIVLLDWNKFGAHLVEDTDALVEFSAQEDLLDHAVIFDATRAGGGSLGAYAIQRLVPEPFKTTFGNLRITDLVEPFIEEMNRRKADGEYITAVDGGDWLIEWLETDVRQAMEEGREYSNDVPFKSSHLPADSDGVLQPTELHFAGPMVCMSGPHGGSHLDQFTAMVVDNDLAHMIGMPTGGYSNTWEGEETLHFPISGKPVMKMMFSMGHTIRPNGQLLEGNPAEVDEFIPLTRDNYEGYDEMLLARAVEYLSKD